MAGFSRTSTVVEHIGARKSWLDPDEYTARGLRVSLACSFSSRSFHAKVMNVNCWHEGCVSCCLFQAPGQWSEKRSDSWDGLSQYLHILLLIISECHTSISVLCFSIAFSLSLSCFLSLAVSLSIAFFLSLLLSLSCFLSLLLSLSLSPPLSLSLSLSLSFFLSLSQKLFDLFHYQTYER